MDTIGKYARRIVSELSDLWSTHPRLSAHETSVHYAKRIDGADQAQGSPAGAAQTQDRGGKPTNDQRAALNTWEAEGGRSAAPAQAGANQ
jgi:hypothetical protein